MVLAPGKTSAVNSGQIVSFGLKLSGLSWNSPQNASRSSCFGWALGHKSQNIIWELDTPLRTWQHVRKPACRVSSDQVEHSHCPLPGWTRMYILVFFGSHLSTVDFSNSQSSPRHQVLAAISSNGGQSFVLPLWVPKSTLHSFFVAQFGVFWPQTSLFGKTRLLKGNFLVIPQNRLLLDKPRCKRQIFLELMCFHGILDSVQL